VITSEEFAWVPWRRKISRLNSIVTGGATGAQRGAIEAATELGLDVFGWRTPLAKDDPLSPNYLGRSKETLSPRMAARLNVQDSDGTLVISFSETLIGGAAYADEAAEHQRKPLLHVVLPAGGRSTIPDEMRASVLEWIAKARIAVLHVTGPTEREAPGIGAAVRDAIVWLFEDETSEMSEVELGELAHKIAGDHLRRI